MNERAAAATPVAAGFLAREVAWSLDALLVAAATALLTWSTVAAGLASLRQAWASLQQAVAARIGDVLLQATDPAALAAQLLRDPALHAAAASAEAALWRTLLPPLLVFAALAAGYWIGFERSAWQATPGKRALALQVTDLQGQRLDLPRAALRHLAGVLSWLSLNLGHALAAVPPHKRALHDYIAGTRVVHAGASQGLPAWARAWLVLQLVAAFGLPLWWVARAVLVLQAGLQG